MRLLKILKGLKHKWNIKSQVLEEKKLCGVLLKTVKGTIRNHVDQDDDWFFQMARFNAKELAEKIIGVVNLPKKKNEICLMAQKRVQKEFAIEK